MKQKLKSLLGFVLAMAMVLSMAPQLTLAARADSTSTEPPVMEADDDSWDIPLADLTVSCGDYEPDGGANEGPANLAVDNNNATMWHTDWYGTSRDNHWFQFNVTGDYAVCGLRYLPRQTGNSNGTITEYEILVSDDGVNFRSVSSGNWAADSTWKIAQFSGEKVSYVRLVALNAETDNDYVFASAAEIRLIYLPTEVSDADKTALNALIAECELIEQGNYTARSWQQFQNALQTAQIISANAYASQEQVDEAYEALAQAKAGLKEKVEGEGIQKIFHLDCGRKYFSKDWIIALLNELSAAGYTHLQLAFGNNGFRFILDDMTIEANGTIYASDAIKEGIKIGNANYYDEGETHSLTESEMNEILTHAQRVGVQIIPHLNMPGHMSALLDAMVHVGISDAHFTGYVQSDSSVNLNNEIALNFMQALVDKYAAYFSEKGCEYFHIGADEYANDAYNGGMGFPSMGATLYQKFADFVNENAAIVMDRGMTPRAWNDGIYYGSYTSEFDSNIEITYWSSGWSGYTLAKASTLDEKGHGLINTHGDYYYILGKNDRFTSGSNTRHDPNLYTECADYDLNHFMDGSVIEYPVGGMFCVWADYPGAETETEVAANIRLVLRAMAMRMDGLEIDDLDTSVVPGGFNEDGTINESEAHEHSFGEWAVTTDSTCTEAGVETRTCECGESETREIAALGHAYGAPVFTWNDDNTASATVTCANDKTHVEELAVTVTSETTDATCETKAVTTYTATVTFDGETYTSTKEVEGEALGHAYGEPVIIWNDDNTASATVICGNDTSHVEVLEVTVTSETVPGDCETEAVTTYTATATFEDQTYTDTKTVEGEYGDHSWTDATCAAPKTCEICGETDGEALGHAYGEPVFTWNDDNTASATVTCANDETHVEELAVTVTSATTEGDCETKAVTTYTATVTFQGKTYTSTKEVEGELGECADENKDHKCDTCEEVISECVDENKDYICDICGAELEKPDSVIRLAGAHRWETAIKVADEMKANLGVEKFNTIIIASGNDFADALAGSYLSTVKSAPILLSWGQGGKYEYLDTDNIEYIKENLAEGGTVYILGGEKAVPASYEEALKDYNVERLGGANRFETNLLILAEAGVNKGDEILVCTSTNFADSLSASATGKPILLVFNNYKALYGEQPEYLATLEDCTFTIVGGESAVCAELETAIKTYGETTRLAGENRFETSVMVAEKYFEAPETAVLAYAWNYPDGLCGGALAYSMDAPLVLTMTNYEAEAVAYATGNSITSGVALGGDGLISDEAVRSVFAMDAADEIIVK